MKTPFYALMIAMTLTTPLHANQDNWKVVNEFGKSKVFVNLSSVERNGNLIRVWVKYALIPAGVDKRNGKDVKEMLISEEYDLSVGRFRVHQIGFIYSDGIPSAPLSVSPEWKPATGGNEKTLELLRSLR